MVSYGRMHAVLLVVLSAFLFGCTSDDVLVEPTPLTSFDHEVQLKKVWSRRIGDGFEDAAIVLRPALGTENVYVADARGLVLALNRENGRRVWKKNLKQAIAGGVTLDEDTLWVTTRNAAVIALDAATGEPRWEAALSSQSLAPVAVQGRTVIVQTQDAHLTCFDRETGQKRWVMDTKIPVLTLRGGAAPRIEGDVVLAGFANGKLISVDINTGELLWERQIGVVQGPSELDRIVDIDGNFVVDSGAVFVSSYQGRLAALDVRGGRPFWLAPIASYRELAVGLGGLYVSDSQGSVWGVDPQTGDTLWEQRALLARRLSGAAVLDDAVLVGDYEGYLHALDHEDGHVIGRKRLDGSPIRTQPLVEKGVAYVLTSAGKLVALKLSPRQ